jgi:hypothetical protein
MKNNQFNLKKKYENKTKQNKTKQNKTKQNKIFIALILLCFFTFSCENVNLEKENSLKAEKNIESYNDDVVLKNGRLSFSSKESISKVFQKYVNASEDSIVGFLNGYYRNDFRSLRPIVNESNESLVYLFYKNKFDSTQLKKANLKVGNDADPLDYLDYIEEVVGDDTFAAFLNADGEIQVSSEIYKYTDVGLFIVNETKYQVLIDYLNSQNISTDLIFPTSDVNKLRINNLFPNEGVSAIDSDISYFKIKEEIPTTGNTTRIGKNTSVTARTEVDPGYNSFLSNLSSCDPHSGIFGNLFGDNDVCIDKYESRRRVKTKAFNYNYLLVYHLGVKCVHQYRGWTGLWRVEATDEIKLIVEAAQFQYDLDVLSGNTIINNQTKERSYFMNNQKIFYSGPNNINFLNEWGVPIVSYTNLTSLPQLFQDNLTIEFFSTGWDWLDGAVKNGIDSNTKASKFNEWFYNGLYSTVTSQIKSAIGNNAVVPSNRTFVAKFPENGKMIIQKSVLDQGFNIGVREKTFDWGANICFSGSGSDGWNIKPNLGCNILVKPTNFRVKIIGAVRNGSQWHGSKFTDGID